MDAQIDPQTQQYINMAKRPAHPLDYFQDERMLVLEGIANGISEDKLAEQLAHHRALAIVHNIIFEAQPNQPPVRQFHIFGVPAKNYTAKQPYHDQYRVQEPDRAAFATRYGVSEASLLRVASGKVEQAGGIRQGRSHGTLDTNRQQMLAEITQRNRPIGNTSSMPADALAGPIGPAKPTKHDDDNGRPAAPIFNFPVIDWTPDSPDYPVRNNGLPNETHSQVIRLRVG